LHLPFQHQSQRTKGSFSWYVQEYRRD
jgi:hypothetical protein